MKLKISSIMVLLCMLGSTKAQLFVQGKHIQPLGEKSYIFKPALGYTLGFNFSEEAGEVWQVIGYITYYSFNTKHDRINSYALTNNLNNTGQTGLVPGYETFSNHGALEVGFMGRHLFLEGGFSPFVGADMFYMTESYDTQRYYEGLIDYDGGESNSYIGLRPNLGINYAFDKWQIAADLGYRMYLGEAGKGHSVNSGFSFTYFFL